MRSILAFLVLTACATESDEDRLDRLISESTVHCGSSMQGCFTDKAATEVVSCMNGAIVSGARADISDTSQDSRGFYEHRYYFVVDHKVIRFYLRDGSMSSSEPSAEGSSPYNGGFRVGEQCTTVQGTGMTVLVDEL